MEMLAGVSVPFKVIQYLPYSSHQEIIYARHLLTSDAGKVYWRGSLSSLNKHISDSTLQNDHAMLCYAELHLQPRKDEPGEEHPYTWDSLPRLCQR